MAALPSALFGRTVSVLRPCVESVLQQPGLAASLAARGQRPADLQLLTEQESQLQQLTARHRQVTEQRAEVARTIAALRTEPASEQQQQQRLAQLTARGAQLRQELRQLQEPLRQLQEVVLPQLVRLPNVLHPATPLQADQQQEDTADSGPELDCLKTDVSRPGLECVETDVSRPGLGYVETDVSRPGLGCVETDSGPGLAYVRGAAAAVELQLQWYFSEQLRLAGFCRLSCPDTVKSLVLEACGLPFERADRWLRLHPRHEGAPDSALALHLVGGASLPALCAHLAKSRLPSGCLPLRLSSAGRQYGVTRCEVSGELRPRQRAAVRHLTACASPGQAEAEFQSMLQLLLRLLRPLTGRLTLVHVHAGRLPPSESRRTELHVYRRPVAHVALHGDYISRRLHLLDQQARPLQLVEGAAARLTELAGLLCQPGRSRPSVLQPYTLTGTER